MIYIWPNSETVRSRLAARIALFPSNQSSSRTHTIEEQSLSSCIRTPQMSMARTSSEEIDHVVPSTQTEAVRLGWGADDRTRLSQIKHKADQKLTHAVCTNERKTFQGLDHPLSQFILIAWVLETNLYDDQLQHVRSTCFKGFIIFFSISQPGNVTAALQRWTRGSTWTQCIPPAHRIS